MYIYCTKNSSLLTARDQDISEMLSRNTSISECIHLFSEYYDLDTEGEITPVKLLKASKRSSKNKATKVKGRNRILRMNDSSSEEETVAEHTQHDTSQPGRQPHRTAVLLSSDTSESESNKDSPEFTQVVSLKSRLGLNPDTVAALTAHPQPGTEAREVDSPAGCTPIPSLKSRLLNKMSAGVGTECNTIGVVSRDSNLQDVTSLCEQPMFSLGIDDMMDGFDGVDDLICDVPDVSMRSDPMTDHTSRITEATDNTLLPVGKESSIQTSVIASVNNSTLNTSSVSISREERLRMSKLKQEEFRKKLAAAKHKVDESSNTSVAENRTIHNKRLLCANDNVLMEPQGMDSRDVTDRSVAPSAKPKPNSSIHNSSVNNSSHNSFITPTPNTVSSTRDQTL